MQKIQQAQTLKENSIEVSVDDQDSTRHKIGGKEREENEGCGHRRVTEERNSAERETEYDEEKTAIQSDENDMDMVGEVVTDTEVDMEKEGNTEEGEQGMEISGGPQTMSTSDILDQPDQNRSESKIRQCNKNFRRPTNPVYL